MKPVVRRMLIAVAGAGAMAMPVSGVAAPEGKEAVIGVSADGGALTECLRLQTGVSGKIGDEYWVSAISAHYRIVGKMRMGGYGRAIFTPVRAVNEIGQVSEDRFKLLSYAATKDAQGFTVVANGECGAPVDASPAILLYGGGDLIK